MAAHVPSAPSSISALYNAVVESLDDDFSNLDDKDITSLDRRDMSRHSSFTSISNNYRSHPPHPPHMSRDHSMGGASSLNRQPLSPSDIEYQVFSPTGSSTSSRENTIPRQSSTYENHTSYTNRSLSYTGEVGVSDTPIRGSGRKDRNRPERGSGRSHTHQLSGGGLTMSPDPGLMNGYATMPHMSPLHQSNDTAATIMETLSLENLRLSDSESNMAFRRDNPGRISITKKSKIRIPAFWTHWDSMQMSRARSYFTDIKQV